MTTVFIYSIFNKSPTKPKLVTGSIGYYKGTWAEIRENTYIRGVELMIDTTYEKARKQFLNTYKIYAPEDKTVVFVDIVDFRKNFVYSEAASLIYAK